MKKLLICASLLMMLASCSKDVAPEGQAEGANGEKGGNLVTVKASVTGGDTRISKDDANSNDEMWKFKWDENDALGAISTGNNSSLNITGESVGSPSATFTGTVSDDFYLVYPYDGTITSQADPENYPIYYGSQQDDLKCNYMAALTDDGVAYPSDGVADLNIMMKHIGAFMSIDLDLSAVTSDLEGYKLTKLTYGSVPISGSVNLKATSIHDCLKASTVMSGVIAVDVNKAVAQSMSVDFDILPFTINQNDKITVRLTFSKSGEPDLYAYVDKKNTTSKAIEFKRATFNTTSISVAQVTTAIPIYTQEDLAYIGTTEGFNLGYYADSDYILMSDIALDCESKDWTPLCNGSISYTGTFDGNDKTISGLKIQTAVNNAVSTFDNKALFDCSSGTIKDINLTDCKVVGRNNVAGIVGQNNGTVSGCSVAGSIESLSTYTHNVTGYTGGVVGSNRGTVKDCTSTATVSGYQHVGGVVGYMDEGKCLSSYNTGSVTGSLYVGGVAGTCDSGIYVVGCYNTKTGSVEATSEVAGGVIGYNTSGNIEACYNLGAVTAPSYRGGVTGRVTSTAAGTRTNFYLENTANYGRGGNGTNGVADDADKVSMATEAQMTCDSYFDTTNSKTIYTLLNEAITAYNEGKDESIQAYPYTNPDGAAGVYPTIDKAN